MNVVSVWDVLPKRGKYTYRDLKQPLTIVYHHTAGNPAATVREVALVHQQRGWAHIGYHYLISRDGVIFKTLPLRAMPICVSNLNTNLICICFIGTYQRTSLNNLQIDSARLLVRSLRKLYTIDKAVAHRDLRPTECPGDAAYMQLRHSGMI